MNSRRGWVVAALAGLLTAGVTGLYLGQRGEGDEEAEREAPIVAPLRVTTDAGGPVVTIDSAEALRMGLETTVLASASAVPPVRLAGTVMDEPERVTTLRAPIAGRLAAASGRRWPAIGDRVEAGAEVAQISDARPMAVPLAGVVTRVGARPGEIVAGGQMLLEIVDRSQPAVRVVWDPSAGPPGAELVLEPPGTSSRVAARLIGPAAEADALTRHPAYLYRAARGWPGATPGTFVTALATSAGPAVRGALVPDGAVVQWDGLAWAYRRRMAGRYERVAVSTERPVAGGWIADRSLAPGDTVVTTGAQELLSEEFRARVSVGDEAGE